MELRVSYYRENKEVIHDMKSYRKKCETIDKSESRNKNTLLSSSLTAIVLLKKLCQSIETLNISNKLIFIFFEYREALTSFHKGTKIYQTIFFSA